MAVNPTALWRVRAGGSATNGGGYDPAISGVLSTTLVGAISSSATTITIASATGYPSSGNFYARIGNTGGETFSSGSVGSSEVVLVTGGQGTTTWTVTRAQLGTSAQAFASGTVVDNELSRCNTAIASGTLGTSTASTAFTDAVASFNSTMVGNALYLASGTGTTVAAYFILAVLSATSLTLDRASGTYTAGVYKIGGAWNDYYPNPNNNAVAGNIIYIRAGGSATVSSPDYTQTAQYNVTGGDTTNGFVQYVGENGRPYVRNQTSGFGTIFTGNSGGTHTNWLVTNFYCVSSVAGGDGNPPIAGENIVVRNVIIDQNGHDSGGISINGGIVDSCEIMSSVANSGTAGASYAIECENRNDPTYYGTYVINCNVHDCWGSGILCDSSGMGHLIGNLVTNNRGDGIQRNDSGYPGSNINNTIDGNHGNGLVLNGGGALSFVTTLGNIISNHTTAGTIGLKAIGGTQAQNDRLRGDINSNTFYNNATNASGITIGTSIVNSVQLSDNLTTINPYVGQSIQNYALSAAFTATYLGKGYPQVSFLQSKSGKTTGVQSYTYPGAVQPYPQMAVINVTRNLYLGQEDSDYAP